VKDGRRRRVSTDGDCAWKRRRRPRTRVVLAGNDRPSPRALSTFARAGFGQQGADRSEIRIGVHGTIVFSPGTATISLESGAQVSAPWRRLRAVRPIPPQNEVDWDYKKVQKRFSRDSDKPALRRRECGTSAPRLRGGRRRRPRQITSQPSTSASAASTSTTLSSSTNGEDDFAGKSSEANDDQTSTGGQRAAVDLDLRLDPRRASRHEHRAGGATTSG
jgi:hypothetical protein